MKDNISSNIKQGSRHPHRGPHGSLRRESQPASTITPADQRWADKALAETAPPRAASFGALRSWAQCVVLASLEGQPYETIKAIRTALVRRLRSYGLGRAETDLLMDLPIPPVGQPAKRSGSRARWRKPAPTLTRRLPDPFRAAWARQAGQARLGAGR